MHIKKSRDLCPLYRDGKRRHEFQHMINPYPGNSCIGCKSCYMKRKGNGIHTKPYSPEKILEILSLTNIPEGILEFVTDEIDAFLHPRVSIVLKAIDKKYPGRLFNLITKLPNVALKSIVSDPNIWDSLNYHIQVTTLMDGEILVKNYKDIEELIDLGISISCRVDPFIPGLMSFNQIESHIEILANIGVKHITTNTIKIYDWHTYPHNVMNFYSNSDRLGHARIVNAEFEKEYFNFCRRLCDKHNINLGVCMSRTNVHALASGPCEGCDLEK